MLAWVQCYDVGSDRWAEVICMLCKLEKGIRWETTYALVCVGGCAYLCIAFINSELKLCFLFKLFKCTKMYNE